MKNGWSPCQQKKGKRPNTVSRVLRTNENLSSVGKVRKGVITSFRKCYLLQKKKTLLYYLHVARHGMG